MSQPPVTLGLVGLGHLGKIHAKCLAMLDSQVSIAGVYDVDFASAKHVSRQYDWPAFARYEDLLEQVEGVVIVTPTTTHAVLAKAALKMGKHVFIEKPVTETVTEAVELERLAQAHGCIVQVGHVERFNPAFTALDEFSLRPAFIEAHRLAEFNPRSTDVSVVLDLMIHDLDLVLSLIDSPLERVSASGVGVVGKSVDIANARLDFMNGATANLTASRISLKQMRKLRIFQPDAYISVDLLKKQTEVLRLSAHDPNEPGPLQLPTEDGLREVNFEQLRIAEEANAIRDELAEFVGAIRGRIPVRVGIKAAREALELAQRIIEDINRRRNSLLAQL